MQKMDGRKAMGGLLAFGVAALGAGLFDRAHAQVAAPTSTPAGTQANGDDDGLSFDEIVITGAAQGLRKFDTSFAISTLGSDDIQQIAPLNTADLLGQVPGIFAEATGGEASNVYRVRGIPNEGNFQAWQEDGLSIYPENAGFFFTGDGVIRTDLMTQSFEFVRGGPAAVYATNATSIYNHITRQGGEETEAGAQVTLGDTGLYRGDAFWSGKVGEKTYLAAGGFYRHHEGYRDNGFPNDKGGQFRLNVRHEVGNGEFRAHFKAFSDNNVFYLPIPLADPRNPSVSLDRYIDFFEGTLNTPSLQNAIFKYRDATGQNITEARNLADGRQTDYINTGFAFEQDFAGFHITNTFAVTDGEIDFDALYSSNPQTDANAAAAAQLTAARTAYGAGVASVGYALAGSRGLTRFDPNLGSGLVVDGQYRSIQNEFQSAQNDLRITRDVSFFGKHQLTVGVNYARYFSDVSFQTQDYLLELSSKPRPLDLVAYSATGPVLGFITDNGVRTYSSTLIAGRAHTDSAEFYFADTWNLTDKLSLELGVRQTEFKLRGYGRNAVTVNLGDAATLADNATRALNGTVTRRSIKYDQTPWTVGANYQVNDQIGVFARASKSYRGPGETTTLGLAGATTSKVDQYEAGVKLDTEKLSIFATLFLAEFEPLSGSTFQLNPLTNALAFVPFTATTKSPGIETDFSWRPFHNFTLDGSFTYNDAALDSLKNAQGISINASGNMLPRQPNVYGNIRPSYAFTVSGWDVETYARLNFVGERFVDFANNTALDAYQTLGAGVTVSNGAWSAQLVGDNLTNEEGVTEGNPRADQLFGQGSPTVLYGRPIFGRNFRVVIGRRW